MAFDIFWMNVAAVFAIINVLLVVLLSVLYLQSWRRVRSTLALSLIAFAVFFLVQNLVIVVFWYDLYGLAPTAPEAESLVLYAAPFLVLINALESLALGNLVRVSWK
jgi:hypothetical protein